MKNQFKFSLSLIALATLTACGGGGGSDGDTSAGTAPVVAACSVKFDAEYGAAARADGTMSCEQATTMVDGMLAENAKQREALIAQRQTASPIDAAVIDARLEILAAQAASLNAMKAQIAANGTIDANLQAQMDKAKADLAAANTKLAAALEAKRVAELPPVVEQPPVAVDPGTTPPVEQPPVVTPPVEQPPVVTPPVEQPPVVTPPVTEPPVVTPPVVTPPVVTPPAAEVKFHGVYTATNGIVISETNGKTWIMDTSAVGPDAVVGDVNMAASSDTMISIPSKSLSYTHADVPVNGTYARQQSASLILSHPANADINLAARNNSLNVVYDVNYDTPLVMPAGRLPAQDFYTGSHNSALTFAADGKSFTGFEETCTFTGLLADTTKGYNKVTITWGENCAVPKDTVGSGVIAKYGDNYIVMTNQAGMYGDIAFVTFLIPNAPTPTAAATRSTRTMPVSTAAKSYMAK